MFLFIEQNIYSKTTAVLLSLFFCLSFFWLLNGFIDRAASEIFFRENVCTKDVRSTNRANGHPIFVFFEMFVL